MYDKENSNNKKILFTYYFPAYIIIYVENGIIILYIFIYQCAKSAKIIAFANR